MNRFTFAHLSDLHLPFEPVLAMRERLSKRQLSAWSWRRRGEHQSAEVLDALGRDLAAHPVDHVVVSGDVVNFSLPGEFEAAMRWLDALAPRERTTIVPGNHDALVRMTPRPEWPAWARAAGPRAEADWPTVDRRGSIAFIGLASARPTAPLLAQGRLGAGQLMRLEAMLETERASGRVRIVVLHHPVADGAVGWRKALVDRAALRAVLARAGADLVLHGHARHARFDALAGAHGPIPVLSVPSSSARPNPHDEAARWHRLEHDAGAARLAVEVRRWSESTRTFEHERRYVLCLARPDGAAGYAAA